MKAGELYTMVLYTQRLYFHGQGEKKSINIYFQAAFVLHEKTVEYFCPFVKEERSEAMCEN